MTARLVVMISGNGSNLQAILDAIRMKALDAQVVGVISNRKDAFGLKRAEKAGVPAHYFPLKPYTDSGRSRAEYDTELARLVRSLSPDFVVLAGWMHILGEEFLQHFAWRVVNLHPALPGTFPGAHALEDALAAYARGEIKNTGVMVHLVPDEEVDAGPVLESAEVLLYPQDTIESLRKRLQPIEHRTLILALRRLIEGDE